MDNCPICHKPAGYISFRPDEERWRCAQCGKFSISGSAVTTLENCRATLDLRKLSAVVRRHPRDADGWMQITTYNLNELIAAE